MNSPRKKVVCPKKIAFTCFLRHKSLWKTKKRSSKKTPLPKKTQKAQKGPPGLLGSPSRLAHVWTWPNYKTESQEPSPETMMRTKIQPSKKVGFHEFSRKKTLSSIPRAEVVNHLKPMGASLKENSLWKFFPQTQPRSSSVSNRSQMRLASWHLGKKGSICLRWTGVVT